MTTIGITGASGQLARLTIDALLERGVDPASLVLVTRSPDAIADVAAKGATVRHGDFDQPDGLPEAFAGIERLLLISASDIGRRIPQHQAAIDAAKAAGVRHVAYTSIANPVEDNPAPVTPEHRATEQALRDSGLAWTFLRNGIYAEFQATGAAQAVASGQLVTNKGDGRTSYVSRADCAAAAAVVLATDGHEGQAYEITGPEAVTEENLAAIASEISGKPIEVVKVDDAALIAGLVEHAGLPEAVAQIVADFGRATREGYLGEVTDTVERLTGRKPRTLREVLQVELPPLLQA